MTQEIDILEAGAMVESGCGLDAIGLKSGIEVPRRPIEADIDYRNRLLVRLRSIRVINATANQWREYA